MDVTPDSLLEYLGLPEYRAALKHAGVVDQAGLEALTDSRLKVLGVEDEGHRERILGAVAALRSESEPEPTKLPEPSLRPAGAPPQDDAADKPTTMFVKATLDDPGSTGHTDPVPVDETPVLGGTVPAPVDLDPPAPSEPPGDTQVFVYGDDLPLPSSSAPETVPTPLGDEEEDADDDASLDRYDGLVSAHVEADDDTDLPQQDMLGVDDEYVEPTGGGLGKVLAFLVALVLIAGVGGWFVIQKALKSDEVVKNAPTAQSLPPPEPEEAAPAPEPEPEPVATDRDDPPEVPVRTEPDEPVVPSFPCSKAESRVELLICGSHELAALDRRMAEAWSAARRTRDKEAFAELRADQKRWLRARDACTDEGCVGQRYRERLAEVE